MATFTKEELEEFDELTRRLSSRDQMARISARLDSRRFVEDHGKEKCDAMFAELERREEARARRTRGEG